MTLVNILFLILFTLNTWAAPKCSIYFAPSAVDILTEINQNHENKIFQNSIDENIQNSFWLSRAYKLFKLKRILKNLEKEGANFDQFELNKFVYKLDMLAFSNAAEPKLSKYELEVLSEARRSVLQQGIARFFKLDKPKTGFKKYLSYLTPAVSWKYWRWSTAMLGMPKLVGTSLPPELAHKVLIEGLETHRAEVEKYLPQIRGRQFFNLFSKSYNMAVILSLFTIVPYMAHDYAQVQMEIGNDRAIQIWQPLVKSTQEMALVNQISEKEIGALENYISLFTTKHGRVPDQNEIELARQIIRTKLDLN